ncbi:MAG: FtsQ-type POTRA domain-containing protein [Patescibacteria group bacterium]
MAVVLGAMAGGAAYVMTLPALRLERLEIKGADLVSPAAIEAKAREVIRGEVWGFIPRDNFFFVSSELIERELRRYFPQLKKVNVAKRFPNRLMVKIEERQLWGIYCYRPTSARLSQGSLLRQISGGQAEPPSSCFYLDTNGTAYEALAAFEGWLLPVIYSPAPPTLGQEAARPEMLEFYGQAQKAASSINGQILTMTMSTTTPADVRLQLAEGWELWVTAERPTAEWLGVIKSVLEKEIGGRRSELDYVDLRFGNKVFYKYK